MSDYNEMSPIKAIKTAFYFLKEIVDTNTWIVSLRVFGWVKTGTAIGILIYSKIRGAI